MEDNNCLNNFSWSTSTVNNNFQKWQLLLQCILALFNRPSSSESLHIRILPKAKLWFLWSNFTQDWCCPFCPIKSMKAQTKTPFLWLKMIGCKHHLTLRFSCNSKFRWLSFARASSASARRSLSSRCSMSSLTRMSSAWVSCRRWSMERRRFHDSSSASFSSNRLIRWNYSHVDHNILNSSSSISEVPLTKMHYTTT